MKKVKYQCKNCKYFNVCGSNTRTEPCKGRELKRKNNEKGDNYDTRRIRSKNGNFKKYK